MTIIVFIFHQIAIVYSIKNAVHSRRERTRREGDISFELYRTARRISLFNSEMHSIFCHPAAINNKITSSISLCDARRKKKLI
jgi:hypothetical protein